MRADSVDAQMAVNVANTAVLPILEVNRDLNQPR